MAPPAAEGFTEDDRDGCWAASQCLAVEVLPRIGKKGIAGRFHNLCDARLVVEACFEYDRTDPAWKDLWGHWSCEQFDLKGGRTADSGITHVEGTGAMWYGHIGARKPDADWTCLRRGREAGLNNLHTRPARRSR